MQYLKWGRWSLIVKLSLATIVLLSLTVVSIALFSVQQAQQGIQAQLERQAGLLLDTLEVASSDALYTLDAGYLEDLIRELKEAKVEFLISGRIYDNLGRVIADSESEATIVYTLDSDPLGSRLVASDNALARSV